MPTITGVGGYCFHQRKNENISTGVTQQGKAALLCIAFCKNSLLG
ncbi:hypothetical protein [Trichocoleus sp. FACHB-40]|nr:hypothetical protein [Trichocoleus sp. FACHB-40]